MPQSRSRAARFVPAVAIVAAPAVGAFALLADWVISQEVDCRKPNPRIFEIAAERVRMRLRGAWMVGDGPEADIGGATTVGIPSVWIHRGRRWTETRFGPTRVAEGVIQAVAEVMAADPQYRMR